MSRSGRAAASTEEELKLRARHRLDQVRRTTKLLSCPGRSPYCRRARSQCVDAVAPEPVTCAPPHPSQSAAPPTHLDNVMGAGAGGWCWGWGSSSGLGQGRGRGWGSLQVHGGSAAYTM
eukprot:2710995-Prymnesium_polylepis.2